MTQIKILKSVKQENLENMNNAKDSVTSASVTYAVRTTHVNGFDLQVGDIIGLDKIESTVIYADKDLIYQVIYNLIDNAIKFTNEHGKICFSLNKEQGAAILKINR